MQHNDLATLAALIAGGLVHSGTPLPIVPRVAVDLAEGILAEVERREAATDDLEAAVAGLDLGDTGRE